MIVTAAMVAALAIAIYLVDCIVLIDRGQAVCEVRRLGVALHVGTTQFTITHRPVVCLNPLTPWRLAVKASAPWEVTENGESAIQPRRLLPLQVIAAVQAILVVVVAPILLHYGRYAELFMAVVAALAASLAGSAWLWRIRRSVNLNVAEVVNSAITSLICLPMSINVARKVAISATPRFSALSWLRRVRGDARDDIQRQYIAQLEEAALEAEDGSRRQSVIREALGVLTKEEGRVGA